MHGDKTLDVSTGELRPEGRSLLTRMNKIEIIGITTCGTYPSWTDYTIASFYNHVDKVVVINAGYNINKPEDGAIHRLEREHKLIKQIDINNKIIEITPKTFNETTLCKQEKDEFGRATNITLATYIAHNLLNPYNKQRWILKLDSDQILHQITREQLESLITQYPNKNGFRFAQYADYYRDFEHISEGLPDEFTNDGSLFYISKPNQWYTGQGSPVINTSQHPITSIVTAHMRRINPLDIDPYEYFFKRYWYHTFGPNSIMELGYNRETGMMLTNEQIIEMAHKQTIATLRDKGRLIKDLDYDERIPFKPPLVCKLGPLEYTKKGY